MNLFEAAWQLKGVTHVREFNTKSEEKISPHKSEYFVPDSLGKYKGLLDNTPLRKVTGSGYNEDQAYGERNSLYVTIREDYLKNGYNRKPNIWYLDIETKVELGSFPDPELAEEEVCLIQLWDTSEKKGYVIGLEEWYCKKDYQYDFDLEYIHCKSEKELFNTFFALFKRLNPLFVYAWNANGFDFPYIYNRLKKLRLSASKLSNYGKVSLKTKVLNNGQTTHKIESQGHIFMDMLDVYKKFVFKNVPNYSLDTIGELETGLRKIEHNNYIKFDDFRIGKYVITGKETEEQKETKLYKCARMLNLPNLPKDKEEKLTTYIKQKSYSDFVDYGVRDFVLLKGIDERQNLTSLMIGMAEKMGCTVEDTLGTLKAWDSYISNSVFKDGLILPPRASNDDPNVVGGYVFEPKVGKHNWILSSDVNSMYPLLGMASFNMSPETFIPFNERPKELQEIDKILCTQDEEKLLNLPQETWEHIKVVAKKYNVSLGVGGAVYDLTKEGVIPKLVTGIYAGRKIAKKEMFAFEQQAIDAKSAGQDNQELLYKAGLKDTEQMTAKIQINSLYGALAAKYFSLYNEQIAQSITGAGRLFIRMLANKVETRLQALIPSSEKYVIYGDTDSIYFQIDNFVKKYVNDKTKTEKTEWCDAFYKKIIEKEVQLTIKEFSERLIAYAPDYIGAEREVIAPSGILIAKKKYAMEVLDLEGKKYPEDSPYTKVQGLEIIKGGTANFAKKYLKEAVSVILNRDSNGVRDWFNAVRDDFLNWPLDDIAKTQGVSKVHNPEWGTTKNGRKVSIPFGSRICVVSNNYIKSNNLTEQFPLIEGGDKVKVLFVHQPNGLKSEAFAFTDVRFAEMFREFIDYDTIFEKHFVSSLQLMLDTVNINLNSQIEELDVW